MKLKLMKDREWAPCCYIIAAPDAAGKYNARDEARTILVHTDWDYPGVASTFGWRIGATQRPERLERIEDMCDHSGTDGTIDCPECGVPAATFITDAAEWLGNNIGAEAEDPGYFAKEAIGPWRAQARGKRP